MENSNYQKDISCKMFDFLCDLVGDEKVVKFRRLFFKIADDILSRRHITVINSGSKKEGLTTKGSDLDVMLVMNYLPVYHCQSETNSKFGLITDTENAAPGFVLLKLPNGNIKSALFDYTYSMYGLLLSSEEFKQNILRISRKIILGFKGGKIHGPCISSLTNDTDTVFCLKSQTWPSVCMQWFHRATHSIWPLLDDVAKIANEGLLYVPIGSKFGSKNENSLEWRMSFSVPETILVHSFNHTQFISYALLKIVLNEVINTNSHVSNLLCSYFMKTVVFWLSEESDPSSWKPENLFTCFQSCLDRLIYWVRIGYCPNYFVPENNMFEGKIVGKCQRNILDFLVILRKEGPLLFNRSGSLSKFLFDDNFRYNLSGSEAEDIAIYPLLRYILINTVKNNLKLHVLWLNKIVNRICGHDVNGGQLTKSIYLIWLMVNYHLITQAIPYPFNISNKLMYPSYKLLLSHCLIGKNINVVSGGALLAAFFYTHKQYEKSLSVTNYALQECTPDKYFVNLFSSLKFEGNCNNNSNFSFLQRHKLSCIYVCNICAQNPKSVFQNKDLTYEVDTNFIKFKLVVFCMVPPNILIHYLRFMCFHHLRNFSERNRCLRDIKFTFEEGFLIDNMQLSSIGTVYFEKAARVANRLNECKQQQMKEQMEFWNFIAESKINLPDLMDNS